MPSQDRRAAGRRRAWGRGPFNLTLESLEERALMAASASSSLPDLVNSTIDLSTNVSDWNGSLEVMGTIKNQGGSATTVPAEVTIYASPVRGIDKYSVPVATVTIPAGLGAGASVPYQTSITLPSTPLPEVSNSGGTVYITTWVNANRAVTESNYNNDKNLGPPYDSAPVVMSAPKPADLVGTTLAVSPTSATWGSTITVTAQVTNDGSGSSPQTTALLSLTPSGLNYGDSTTIGIGTITVPPLAPYQTINLVQNITLPAVEPLAINNYTNFGLTMTEDANYLTNDLYPNQPTQGEGYDQTPITITTSSTSTATSGPLPDLAASSIIGPTGTIRWGQSFQVSTVVQNVGAGDAGPFQVFFLLTGQTGSTSDAIYLGQANINGLAAGASQSINQTLTLPTVLPSGVTLNNVGYARIAEIVDPDNMINVSLRSNSQSISAPFIVRLPGTASTVPTTQAAGSLPSVETVAEQAQQAAKLAAAKNRAAKIEARRAAHPAKKLERRKPPTTDNLVDKAISLGTELTKLPHQAESVIAKSI